MRADDFDRWADRKRLTTRQRRLLLQHLDGPLDDFSVEDVEEAARALGFLARFARRIWRFFSGLF
ncbi:MAG: hypothetical protein GWM92_15810 [Gemmatimonadetes bacterium]|nr:hypothetical protein [Gemmatimonadota bacterium]NIR80198.1 hypothetical protein [Gemmatimonadota bacterium]NIT88960.1 hypothetical protein [Gemmatimonadota bacterium]NIU32755.1 hypothetical protein [Gemmatimonadota bacterium]NIU37187.1 hypothetical protein [Gemmatimonadota bacterium]